MLILSICNGKLPIAAPHNFHNMALVINNKFNSSGFSPLLAPIINLQCGNDVINYVVVVLGWA
jgi:hypothetical protein